MSDRRAWSHDELVDLIVELTGHGVKAAIDRSLAKAQVPRVTPGTVTTYDPGTDVALVELDEDVPEDDEDPSAIPAQNLTGCPLLPGQRVMFQYAPPHGGFVVGYCGAALRPWMTFVEGADVTGVASSTSTMTPLTPGSLYGSPGIDELVNVSGTTIECLIPAVWNVSGVARSSLAFGTAGTRFCDFLRTDADGVTTSRYYGGQLPPAATDVDSTIVPTATYPIPLGPGDTLQFRMRQSSGGPLDLRARHISLTWVSAPSPVVTSF